ncbi:hypothetical protein BGZ98_006252, partial [Dissophora globulifera]
CSESIQERSETDPIPVSPENISRTTTTYITQLAESIQRLWAGTVYSKTLDRLLLLLLRLHLAPNREQRQRDHAHGPITTSSNGKGKDKAEATKQAQDRCRRANKIRHLCDDLDAALESQSDHHEARVENILALLLRYKEKQSVGRVQRLLPIEQEIIRIQSMEKAKEERQEQGQDPDPDQDRSGGQERGQDKVRTQPPDTEHDDWDVDFDLIDDLNLEDDND